MNLLLFNTSTPIDKGISPSVVSAEKSKTGPPGRGSLSLVSPSLLASDGANRFVVVEVVTFDDNFVNSLYSLSRFMPMTLLAALDSKPNR